MGGKPKNNGYAKKKGKLTERKFTTALFLLRCYQLGFQIADLDRLTYGMVVSMMIEAQNDDIKYNYVATQDDFDKF